MFKRKGGRTVPGIGIFKGKKIDKNMSKVELLEVIESLAIEVGYFKPRFHFAYDLLSLGDKIAISKRTFTEGERKI